MHTSPAKSLTPNCSVFFRSVFLLVTFFLLVGTAAAQPTQETPENAFMRLVNEGMLLVADGSPSSLTKAIEKFESAKVALRPLNLPVGDAVMLTMMGYAYSQLEQNQKAIEKYEQSLPLFRAAGEQKGE